MKLDTKVVEAVTTLLAQHAACHPKFFETVAVGLEQLGYTLVAEQRGAQGTHLCVRAKDQDPYARPPAKPGTP